MELLIGENLSEEFPIQNGLKQGDALSPLCLDFRMCYQEGSKNWEGLG
jgi:hypothetical protein